MNILKTILATKLDTFDYCWAIGTGTLEAYWFGGDSAFGTLAFQVVTVLLFKTAAYVAGRIAAKTLG